MGQRRKAVPATVGPFTVGEELGPLGATPSRRRLTCMVCGEQKPQNTATIRQNTVGRCPWCGAS